VKDDSLISQQWPELLEKIRTRTPARLFQGRVGSAYRTSTQLDLRQAHAAAQDAVRAELNLEIQFGAEFIKRWRVFEVCSKANSKEEYLLQPGLGRVFAEASRNKLQTQCTQGNDLQIAIGDGLSIAAIQKQVPSLLPLVHARAKARGWTIGEIFVIRHCRVGILNEIGALLAPTVAVLLIGERPGLATAESISAYMAYKPQGTHTDSNRNLISNIHGRGISPAHATDRILDLAARMMKVGLSGTRLMPGVSTLVGNMPDEQTNCRITN
jgi:ethanolamine ammonia-lyase small subunit